MGSKARKAHLQGRPGPHRARIAGLWMRFWRGGAARGSLRTLLEQHQPMILGSVLCVSVSTWLVTCRSWHVKCSIPFTTEALLNPAYILIPCVNASSKVSSGSCRTQVKCAEPRMLLKRASSNSMCAVVYRAQSSAVACHSLPPVTRRLWNF